MSDRRSQDELRRFVSRDERKVFSLALYLIGGDQNTAYEIASSAFAEAIREAGSSDVVLSAVAAKVVEKSRVTKAMPSFDPACLVGVADHEKGVLGIVGQALQSLSFDEKALILLRDQAHLSYKDITLILGGDARTRTEEARARLRANIKGWTQRKDALPDGM